MVADQSGAELREELRLIEEELAELRNEVTKVRRRLGERADAPTDPAEIARILTTAEEQEAFIAQLESRRDGLLERLGQRR